MSDREVAGVHHRNIEKANQQKNPFACIAEKFKNKRTDDLKAEISYRGSKEMPKDLQKWCFKLAEKNVGPYYKDCKLGWQPKVKQTDMAKVILILTSKFLISSSKL